MEYLFSYGTLQKDRVQLDLFGRLLTGTKDVLKGYRTSSIEITDESFLSKGEEKYQLTALVSDDTKDAIEGVVFEISEEELLLADEYEPDGYIRVKVELESGKRAWVYQKVERTTPSAEAAATPSFVRRGAKKKI